MTIIVYKCVLPSGSYIGITSQKLKTRIYQHIWLSEKDKPRLDFHRALKREESKAEWVVVAEVLDWETACLVEKDLILNLGTSKIGVGFNLTLGGDGTIGRRYTDEEKLAISIRMKGRKLSEKTKRKISKTKIEGFHPLRGVTMPLEWKEKIRLAGIGRKNTKDTKMTMSESALKRWKNNPINLFDVWNSSGDYIGRWNNIRECSEALGIKASGIGNCLSTKAVSHCGYKFKRIGDVKKERMKTKEQKAQLSLKLKESWKNRLQSSLSFDVFDSNGKHIGTWNNQHGCAKDLGLKQGKINECLRNPVRNKSHRGYSFRINKTNHATSTTTPAI